MDADELRRQIGVYTEAVFMHSIALGHGKTHQEAADAIMQLITSRDQSIKEQAESDLLYELYYAADHNSLVEKLILEKIEARGLTKHHVVPSHSTNNLSVKEEE